MNDSLALYKTRFIDTLAIVAKEAQHLSYSWHRLFTQTIDLNWVGNLEHTPELAEQLEAFISRFGRMQDTMADKLFPRWLQALAETPGSQIETLNRAERLGVLLSTEQWLAMRGLRNRLVHEYMTDAGKFMEDLNLAREYSAVLITTYNNIRQDAIKRMGLDAAVLPAELLDLPFVKLSEI